MNEKPEDYFVRTDEDEESSQQWLSSDPGWHEWLTKLNQQFQKEFGDAKDK